MMEHEHSNHPTFKFVVEAEYIGQKDPTEPEYTYQTRPEAFIYTDGNIVLTMFEYTYNMYFLREGKLLLSNLDKRNTWKLTDASIEKINANR